MELGCSCPTGKLKGNVGRDSKRKAEVPDGGIGNFVV